MNNCLCGKLLDKHNCLSIVKGVNKAITAEELMRSRFVAFKICDIDYIVHSFAEKTKPKSSEKKDILSWARSVEFVNLEILACSAGLENDSKGTVEFIAYFTELGKEYSMRELSSFEKENGVWKYVDGIFPK